MEGIIDMAKKILVVDDENQFLISSNLILKKKDMKLSSPMMAKQL